MGIRAKFTNDAIRKIMANEAGMVHRAIVERLNYIGLHAISLARDYHERNYKDQTGNLRASIGYVVTYNGNIVNEGGFDPDAATRTLKEKDGETGSKEGKSLAYKLAERRKKGFVLIVVAGMQYGKYVEKRDYDVLTFTEANARIMADKLFKEIFKGF
jgi:hypothetical protein